MWAVGEVKKKAVASAVNHEIMFYDEFRKFISVDWNETVLEKQLLPEQYNQLSFEREYDALKPKNILRDEIAAEFDLVSRRLDKIGNPNKWHTAESFSPFAIHSQYKAIRPTNGSPGRRRGRAVPPNARIEERNHYRFKSMNWCGCLQFSGFGLKCWGSSREPEECRRRNGKLRVVLYTCCYTRNTPCIYADHVNKMSAPSFASLGLRTLADIKRSKATLRSWYISPISSSLRFVSFFICTSLPHYLPSTHHQCAVPGKTLFSILLPVAS